MSKIFLIDPSILDMDFPGSEAQEESISLFVSLLQLKDLEKKFSFFFNFLAFLKIKFALLKIDKFYYKEFEVVILVNMRNPMSSLDDTI
ncbi:hypothetical protein BpHYR1_052005 [Brachionus plicatilis]|uniref:Uncharacterized protein n=1 Tax=Brachionus plicatilis TaxID=10195 RepID=A0A3M7SBI9_BRAPC|nr:hypothetical protein BpHYR1_052005 [Brachionus plicatilis]